MRQNHYSGSYKPVYVLISNYYTFVIIVCVSNYIESIDPMQSPVLRLTMLLLLIIILAFGSFFLAAMAAFLLLDQKMSTHCIQLRSLPWELPAT